MFLNARRSTKFEDRIEISDSQVYSTLCIRKSNLNKIFSEYSLKLYFLMVYCKL